METVILILVGLSCSYGAYKVLVTPRRKYSWHALIFLFITGTTCLAGSMIINTESPKKPVVVDLPEEILEAKAGDLLRVEKVTNDSILIGFSKIKPEYTIELIDQKNAKVSKGTTLVIVPFDSIQSYIQNDNL